MDLGRIFLELGAVILALALLGRAAGRVGITPIPLYLIAGIVFGALFHLGGGAEDFVHVGAEIGAVLLLFVLGLEYTSEELRGNLQSNAPMGLLDLALNFTPGVLAGLLLGFSPLGAVLLGGVTYLTSSGIASKVLSDLGRLGNRETPIVLAVCVLEDMAMAVYLPVVASLLVGGGLIATGLSVGAALLAFALALLSAMRFGPALSRLINVRSNEALLLSVFGLVLLVAGAADLLRVSAAIGAFLVGIALSGEVAERARGLIGAAARPLRRDLLRLFRPSARPRRGAGGAVAGRAAGLIHHPDQAADRLDRGRAPRRAGARPFSRRGDLGAARRVQHPDRGLGGHGRHRAGPRAAGGGLRVAHRRRRSVARAAGRPAGAAAVQARPPREGDPGTRPHPWSIILCRFSKRATKTPAFSWASPPGATSAGKRSVR